MYFPALQSVESIPSLVRLLFDGINLFDGDFLSRLCYATVSILYQWTNSLVSLGCPEITCNKHKTEILLMNCKMNSCVRYVLHERLQLCKSFFGKLKLTSGLKWFLRILYFSWSDSVDEGFLEQKISAKSYISKGENVSELLPIGFSWCWTGSESKYMLILYYIPQSWVIENINQLESAIFFRSNFFRSETVKWKLGCKITNAPIFSTRIDCIY